jgi:hypothetical protein
MEIEKPNINLFIVGAAKSGTTSLYQYLNQHPDIFFPNVKEPNYYSKAESHNPAAYLKPRKGKFYHEKIIRERDVYFSLFDEAENQSILADSSPSYLWDENAANNIYKDFPKTKIIILLRNPVQRVFSHFLMDLKDGTQKERSFKQALLNDKAQNPKIWGKAHLYTEISLYTEQVKRYYETFSKENVKIILYEDFIKNTEKILSDICLFLSIDPNVVKTIDFNKIHNPYVIPKNRISKLLLTYKNKLGLVKLLVPKAIKEYLNKELLFKSADKPELSIEDKKHLYNIFQKDILELEKLTDLDLSVWEKL